MSDWQPIKTAPKDGSTVLLYEESEPTICSGWYDIEGGDQWRPSRGQWFFKEPTHWMPLPSPPNL